LERLPDDRGDWSAVTADPGGVALIVGRTSGASTLVEIVPSSASPPRVGLLLQTGLLSAVIRGTHSKVPLTVDRWNTQPLLSTYSRAMYPSGGTSAGSPPDFAHAELPKMVNNKTHAK